MINKPNFCTVQKLLNCKQREKIKERALKFQKNFLCGEVFPIKKTLNSTEVSSQRTARTAYMYTAVQPQQEIRFSHWCCSSDGGATEQQWAGLPGEPWADMQAVDVLTDEVFEVSGPLQSQQSQVRQAGPGVLESDVEMRRLPLFF